MFAPALAVAILAIGCSGEEPSDDDPDAGRTDATAADAGTEDTVVDPVGDEGPGRVLDVPAAHETENLDIRLSVENSGEIPVNGFGLSSTVWELDVRFTSQTLWGETWRHDTSLFVPIEAHPEAADGALAIVQGAPDNAVAGVSKPSVFRNNYGAIVAASMGVPAMVVTGMPGPANPSSGPDAWTGNIPGRCRSGRLPTERYTPCLLQILRRTGDLEADPFRHVAFAWMRAVTAGAEAARRAGATDWPESSPPAFRVDRAVVFADGELAVGARMAAAVDPRIDGVYGNADFAKLDPLLTRIESRWSGDHGWFRNLGAFRRWLRSESGQSWKTAVDPAEWPDLLEGMSFVNARGTNDPRFPLGSGTLLAEVFPEDTRSVTAANYEDGIGSRDHLMGWYGFIAHTYLDHPWRSVAISTGSMGGNVRVDATLAGDGQTNGVAVDWPQQHRESDDLDYRDVVWQSSALEGSGDNWSGDVAPIADHYAVYAQGATPFEVELPKADAEPWTFVPRWSSSVVFFGE